MSYLKDLRADRKKAMAEMSTIIARGQLSNADRERFDSLKLTVGSIDSRISSLVNNTPDDRGRMPGRTRERKAWKNDKRTEGRANEPLGRGQSYSEWFRKAQENNVSVPVGDGYGQRTVSLRNEGTDRDLNRYWGERLGFCKPSVESRALGEDTVGSGQAIAPQAWTAQFIDVLLPNSAFAVMPPHPPRPGGGR
jgi:hypothetical protein